MSAGRMVSSTSLQKELAPGLVLPGSTPALWIHRDRRLAPSVRHRTPATSGWNFQHGPGCRHAGGGMGIMHSTSGS